MHENIFMLPYRIHYCHTINPAGTASLRFVLALMVIAISS
jgi:hypothetical protein